MAELRGLVARHRVGFGNHGHYWHKLRHFAQELDVVVLDAVRGDEVEAARDQRVVVNGVDVAVCVLGIIELLVLEPDEGFDLANVLSDVAMVPIARRIDDPEKQVFDVAVGAQLHGIAGVYISSPFRDLASASGTVMCWIQKVVKQALARCRLAQT